MPEDARSDSELNGEAPPEPEDGGPAPWVARRDPWAWTVAGVYLALAIATGFIHELGYAADETSRHFPYVEWLAHEWRLPPNDPRVEAGPLELHPPLYYLALTPVYLATRPFGRRAALRALRLTSPFLVAIVLLLWFRVIRRACGNDRRTTLFAFALTAWWPNLFVDASMLTNDVGALLTSSALLYLVAVKHWESRSVRSAAWWGLVIGLGGLAKASVPVATVPVVVVALIWQHGRRFWADGRFWGRLGTSAAVCAAVCGWWYVHQQLTQGTMSGISTRMGYSLIPPGMSKLEAVVAGIAQPLAWRAVKGMWMSVFGGVVWWPPWSVTAVYGTLLALTFLALAGITGRLLRWRGGVGLPQPQAAAIVLAATGFGTILLADIYVSTFIHAGFYQGGRYLLPFLPGLTIPFTLGVKHVLPARARTVGLGVLVAVFLCLNFLAWYYIITYWNPYVLATAGRFH